MLEGKTLTCHRDS